MRHWFYSVVVLFGLLAATAVAKPPLYNPPRFPRSDGVHRFVWQHGPSVYVVEDGRPWTHPRVLAAPNGCGTFTGIGSGYAVFSCEVKGEPPLIEPQILNLRTGRISLPARRDALLDYERSLHADSLTAGGVGRSLIELSYGGYHYSGDVEWNWHTGRLFKHLDPGGAGHRLATLHAFDLDYPTGLRPLCAPLRLRIFRGYDEFTGDPFDYTDLAGFEPPYLVRDEPRGTFLQRCGSKIARLLTKHAETGPLVTKSYVAWVTRRSLVIYRFGVRRFERWELPHTGLHTLVGTRGSLIVNVSSNLRGGCPCTLRAVDLVRRRAARSQTVGGARTADVERSLVARPHRPPGGS